MIQTFLDFVTHLYVPVLMDDNIAFPINIGCTGCSIVPCIGIGKNFSSKSKTQTTKYYL